MPKYQRLTDKELFQHYLTATSPNQSPLTIKKTVDALFTHQKNILDLLTTINCDHLLDSASQQNWELVRSIYYRANQESFTNLIHFKNVTDINSYLTRHFHGLLHEEVLIIGINSNNDVIDEFVINIGGAESTIINVKEILRWTIETNSNGIIMAHNHPNSSLTPTQTDIDASNRLAKALTLIDSVLVDSIIVNNTTTFSLANKRLIK